MESVWFDFGNGPVRHDEETLAELNAFIAGALFTAEHCGIDDFMQYDSEAELPLPVPERLVRKAVGD